MPDTGDELIRHMFEVYDPLPTLARGRLCHLSSFRVEVKSHSEAPGLLKVPSSRKRDLKKCLIFWKDRCFTER